MKSCNCIKEGDGSGGKFSTVAIQLLLWAIYYFTYLRLSRLKFRLLLCSVIKFRAQLKAAQLAKFSFMSRHIIVCHDISKLWEDKSSAGCDIRLRHQASPGIVKLSRPHHSFEGITLVATQMFCRDLNFCRDIIFCRDPTFVLPSVLTK